MTFFSETSENDTEKPQPTIFKNKNLSLESLNPQALMLLQAYFAQTKTTTATVKDNHVHSEPPSKVEVRKKKFNWNFSDANWQVWNRSLHCFAQRNKSELSMRGFEKETKTRLWFEKLSPRCELFVFTLTSLTEKRSLCSSSLIPIWELSENSNNSDLCEVDCCWRDNCNLTFLFVVISISLFAFSFFLTKYKHKKELLFTARQAVYETKQKLFSLEQNIFCLKLYLVGIIYYL